MSAFFDFLLQNIKTFNLFSDTIDILIVAVVIYFVIRFVKETQAAPLMKGIIVLLIIWGVSDVLKFNVTSFLVKGILDFGILAVIIIFQPEIRTLLERVGRSKIKLKSIVKQSEDAAEILNRSIDAIVSACAAMSKTKTGALIVVEGGTKLGNIVETGTVIDAAMSDEMVQNIFYPKAPLHDGAAIVRHGRIVAAGCVLPLTKNPNLSSELGTRHRASLGVSEASDCMAVVVSEESGFISVAHNGVLTRNISPMELRDMLRLHLSLEEEKSAADKALSIFRKKEK